MKKTKKKAIMIARKQTTNKIMFYRKETTMKKVIQILLICLIIAGTIVTPILLHNVGTFNFEILPVSYYLFVVLLLIIYTILVQSIKKVYIRKNGEWL